MHSQQQRQQQFFVQNPPSSTYPMDSQSSPPPPPPPPRPSYGEAAPPPPSPPSSSSAFASNPNPNNNNNSKENDIKLHEEFRKRMEIEKLNRERQARNAVQERLHQEFGENQQRPEYRYGWEPINEVSQVPEFTPNKIHISKQEPNRDNISIRGENYQNTRRRLENMFGGDAHGVNQSKKNEQSSPRLEDEINQNMTSLNIEDTRDMDQQKRPPLSQYEQSFFRNHPNAMERDQFETATTDSSFDDFDPFTDIALASSRSSRSQPMSTRSASPPFSHPHSDQYGNVPHSRASTVSEGSGRRGEIAPRYEPPPKPFSNSTNNNNNNNDDARNQQNPFISPSQVVPPKTTTGPVATPNPPPPPLQPQPQYYHPHHQQQQQGFPSHPQTYPHPHQYPSQYQQQFPPHSQYQHPSQYYGTGPHQYQQPQQQQQPPMVSSKGDFNQNDEQERKKKKKSTPSGVSSYSDAKQQQKPKKKKKKKKNNNTINKNNDDDDAKQRELQDKDYALALLLQEQEEERLNKEKQKGENQQYQPNHHHNNNNNVQQGTTLSRHYPYTQPPNFNSGPASLRHEQIRYFAARIVNQAIQFIVPGGRANLSKKVHVIDILEDSMLLAGIDGIVLQTKEQYDWLVDQLRRLIQPAFMVRAFGTRHVSIDVHEYGLFSNKSIFLKRGYLSGRIRNVLNNLANKQRDGSNDWRTQRGNASLI